MIDPLRLAQAPFEAKHETLVAFIRAEPVLMDVLQGICEMQLPDGMIVAGALYNLVWNRLSGRPGLADVNDIDVFYFDLDLSWEAEDRVIRQVTARFSHLPLPVQARNQARVHLWFREKFGAAEFAPLQSSAEMLGRYASKAHALGARLEADDSLSIVAPFGFDDVFAFRVAPNPVLPNKATHDKKAARAKALWPEITIVPWPE
jgi:hypothetical protein